MVIPAFLSGRGLLDLFRLKPGLQTWRFLPALFDGPELSRFLQSFVNPLV
jgi:hypothetical protein